MIAFEVRLNAKKLCVAGVGNDGVLTAIVDFVARPQDVRSELDVGGLISSTNEHVKWLNRTLRIGDEVTVKVVDTTSVNKPRKRQRSDPAKELEHQKHYVKTLAKQLGWKIVGPK